MADEQAQPKKSKLPWILGGCCGCLVLVVAGFFALGGLAVFGAVKLTEPAVAETRAFLAQTTAGDVHGAYGHFHSELKKVLDEPKFKEMVDGHPELFQVKDSTFVGRNFTNGIVRLDGTVVNNKDETEACHFELAQEDGGWKLTEFKITPKQ